MNATLAGWLDYDLAQFELGQLKTRPTSSPATGRRCSPPSPDAPARCATDQFDVDLKRRNGRLMPARLLHRVAFASDGAPGPSRTLVINRAPGETNGQDDLRAAEVRFARIFNSTPIAIASIDRDGRASSAPTPPSPGWRPTS